MKSSHIPATLPASPQPPTSWARPAPRNRCRSVGVSLFLAGCISAFSTPSAASNTDVARAPIYQELKSFGKPSTGGHLRAGLIQGTDGALYGTAADGGANYSGTVFRLNPDGSGLTVLVNFDYSTTGGQPRGGLVQGTDGKLYGTTSSGGNNYGGTVFRLNTDGTGFSVLKHLEISATGGSPEAGLIQGSDGVLYGTTSEGGSGYCGTLFKLNTNGTGFSVLWNFDYGASGARPRAALLQGTDDVLYGTASEGGSNYGGTVFRLNTDGSGFGVLQHLEYGSTGSSPSSRLLEGADGSLYGTACYGGSADAGTLFRLERDGTDFIVLGDLDYSTTGGYPLAGLTQGTDGALYGTASSGGSASYGTVFRMETDGSGFSVLQNADYFTSGGLLESELLLGADGALYGTAYYGGTRGDGTAFRLSTDGSGFMVVGNFTMNADTSEGGGNLYCGLLQGVDGMLYGTTYVGGSYGYGTLFRMNPDGTGFSVLKNLDYSTTGGYPQAGLTQGTDGALYGAASFGGSSGYGTVFKLNPDGTGFAVLRDFDLTTTGGYVDAALIQGTDGALYGTAASGGSGGYGTVFRLNTDGGGFTVLQNFDYATTGGQLYAGLVQATGGALYGTTFFGGSSGYGTVFKINPDGTGFQVLRNLDYSTSGGFPQAGLMQGSGGALYGTTSSGGSNGVGTVFKLNPNGSGFTVLENLEYSTSGAYPSAGLIQDADGVLYGTTSAGGSTGSGTVFTLNPDGSDFTVLENFDDSTTGFGAMGALLLGTDGFLYGTTSSGGEGGAGTIFRLVASTGLPTIAVLWPPNHDLVQVGITGLGDAGATATVVITSVTQDEPTNGLGDGDTPVDAIVNSDGTVMLRAERSGTGNGRVYHIHFVVLEGNVPGLVTVSVPRQKKGVAVDGGELYDSTN